MTRNLHRRVELMFPIKEKHLQKRLNDIFRIYWKDNTKAWQLLPDGSYKKITPTDEEEPFCAQDHFLKEIQRVIKKSRINVVK